MVEQHVMLAHQITPDDLSSLTYPLMASAKYDGVRAFVDYQGDLRSRADRRFNNGLIYSWFGKLPYGLDGEIVTGNSPGDTTSFVNSHEKSVLDAKFYVFDYCRRDYRQLTFTQRLRRIDFLLSELYSARPFMKGVVIRVSHEYVNNAEEALAFYNATVERAYPEGEGMCLRSPEGVYKFGRSTLKQSYLLKVKEVEIDEACVVRLEPLIKNGTVQNSLGAIVCKSRNFDDEFNIGTGFDDETRYRLWRSLTAGSIVKFKYKIQGSVSRPIQPVYLGVSNYATDF